MSQVLFLYEFHIPWNMRIHRTPTHYHGILEKVYVNLHTFSKFLSFLIHAPL